MPPVRPARLTTSSVSTWKLLLLSASGSRMELEGARPATPETDDLVALAEGTEGDSPDGGVQSRNVAAAGEDTDDAFGLLNISHNFTSIIYFKLRLTQFTEELHYAFNCVTPIKFRCAWHLLAISWIRLAWLKSRLARRICQRRPSSRR